MSCISNICFLLCVEILHSHWPSSLLLQKVAALSLACSFVVSGNPAFLLLLLHVVFVVTGNPALWLASQLARQLGRGGDIGDVAWFWQGRLDKSCSAKAFARLKMKRCFLFQTSYAYNVPYDKMNLLASVVTPNHIPVQDVKRLSLCESYKVLLDPQNQKQFFPQGYLGSPNLWFPYVANDKNLRAETAGMTSRHPSVQMAPPVRVWHFILNLLLGLMFGFMGVRSLLAQSSLTSSSG